MAFICEAKLKIRLIQGPLKKWMESSKLALSTRWLNKKPSNFTQTQNSLGKICGKAAKCNSVKGSIHFEANYSQTYPIDRSPK